MTVPKRVWAGPLLTGSLHRMDPPIGLYVLPPRAWGGGCVAVCAAGQGLVALFFCVVNLVLVRLWARRATRLVLGLALAGSGAGVGVFVVMLGDCLTGRDRGCA